MISSSTQTINRDPHPRSTTRVESIHNTVKMQFKNLAILAAAGTAVAEFAIITTPIPTNLGEVLTNVRSPIYASSFSNL